jgi:murein DD-endopeptidase MepM/ murein hydrolase activator NlpD
MRRALIVATLTAAATVVLLPGRASAAPDGYIPPLRGPIIRHFEPPPTPYSAGHRGIDIAADAGSVVVASAAGVVAFAGSIAGERFVSIDHPDGIRTTYSFLDAVLVAKGKTVAQGEPIARSGLGHAGSAQPHLHFGAKIGDEYLDPEALLVSRFRRDYSDLIRLAPLEEGEGRVHGHSPVWLAAIAAAPRRRRRADGEGSCDPGGGFWRAPCAEGAGRPSAAPRADAPEEARFRRSPGV